MSDALYIVDIIEDVIDEVRSSYTPPSSFDSESPFYEYGHPLEIVNTLSEKEKNGTFKFKKYPMIALFQDFREGKGVNQAINASTELNMVICVNTSKDFKSKERYTNTFKTVLYPLYNLFISKLMDSPYIQQGVIPHDKYDRPYWGREEKHVFSDYIDAIEIQNLELDFYNHVKKC